MHTVKVDDSGWRSMSAIMFDVGGLHITITSDGSKKMMMTVNASTGEARSRLG